MFALHCKIIIGPYTFSAVQDVSVKRSIRNFTETAVIRLPASARLKTSHETNTVQTASNIKTKMPVSIQLGYNNKLQEEFKGFVSKVNLSTPCEIECEGFFQPLKYTTYDESFKSISLKNLLEYLIAPVKDSGIQLSSTIPDVHLGSFYCDKRSGTEILESLKKDYHIIAVYFRGDTLFAGLQYTDVFNEVKYSLGWNVLKSDELKFRSTDEHSIRLIMRTRKPDGTILSATAGEGKETEISQEELYDHVKGNSDQQTLENLRKKGEAKLKELTFNGYEGKITAFLQPFALPGDACDLLDEKFPERNGKYIINSTDVTFGRNGARRVLEIGARVN